MTVSYQYDVASSASGGFIRLLFRWRGSVWKVVYREMLLFTACYVLLTVLYQFVLAESQQKIFEKIVFFCSTFMDLIPLSFMLGFYVSFIAARWWSQFIAIPWPDKLMNIVAMYVPGLDEASRVVRRTLMRYLNLSLVLVLRSISMAVKRRFPTKEHLVEAGFMTKTELEMFQSVPSTEFNTFWIPCTWFINVLREARQECRITDSNGLKLIMEELNEFRSKCGLLWGYDWISIPLVYTQVVTMATYAFFVACMFGRQNINTVEPAMKTHRYDYYIPIFTILQLMFYMGLLKVAEQLINPFGDDDEDFELNWIIDRHMKVSYLGVDTLNGTPPPLVKDTYYDELDVKIPYTEASRSYKKKTYRGSVAYMQVPMEQQGMVLPDMSDEDNNDGERMSDTMGARRASMYSLFQGSNWRGPSPSTSVNNLDNVSLDSEWKCSLNNLADPDVKNASGTLGCDPTQPFVVEMDKAEDDEIILQEVIVDTTYKKEVSLTRSDSLLIPGVSEKKGKKSCSLLSVLRDISPKIAPKFPREKLKSMFRKSRKMSMSVPFYKVKGVRFSRDTKVEDQESVAQSESLLDVQGEEAVEVEITLSNPELTEAEKRMGVHPYYYVHQRASHPSIVLTPSSAKATVHARRVSHDEINIAEELACAIIHPPARSISLPNFQDAEDLQKAIEADLSTSPLRKFIPPKKDKGKRHRKKKKSPPPSPATSHENDNPSDQEIQSDPEILPEEAEISSRRNTLPQIILTRDDRKTPEHLDLATPYASSGPSSDHSSDSVTPIAHHSSLSRSSTFPSSPKKTIKKSGSGSSSERLSTQQDQLSAQKKEPSQSPTPSPSSTRSSKAHSTPQTSQKSSPQSSQSKTFKRPVRTESLSSTRLKTPTRLRTPSPTSSKTSNTQTKSSPLSKKGLLSPLKIPKVSSSSLSSESDLNSPTSLIPKVTQSPSYLKSSKKNSNGSSRSPATSPEVLSTKDKSRPPVLYPPNVHSETGSATDSQGELSSSSNRRTSQTNPPPDPPQRHIPRRGSRGRK